MSTRSEETRAPPRGPAGRRRGGGGLRSDRDGDLTMDVAVKGRGRIGKSAPRGPRGDATARTSRAGLRGGILSGNARRRILSEAAAGDVPMKGGQRTGTRAGSGELKITGWEKSKLSSEADKGVGALIKWLERKASSKLGTRARQVKIKESRVDGTDLYISVSTVDLGALLRMNGYEWAGTNINIRRADGTDDASGLSAHTQGVKDMLKGVLERRYNAETKLLDLSALGQDGELQQNGVFVQTSTISKIFPAMMKVLETSFDTPAERDTAVTSVTLANNSLADLSPVTILSLTLPKLQNLDLSHNKFEKLSVLENWRRRFHSLQHLVLSGNPIEQQEPDYPAEVVKWYPTLQFLNNVQVRTEEDVKKRATVAGLPFPIRSAHFQDEQGIAESFIRTFIAGFDNDRSGLASHYYDAHSDFSFAINTHAPRDPTGPETMEKQAWDQYIKNSRNLKKISQLPARQNRLFRGTEAVQKAFEAMPKTKHPDLAAEARKWMIEAHILPNVPDAQGQNAAGVDGFMVTVHGEFEEVDTTSGQPKKKRSFDRTFILGPGGASGVRIVNDMLTVRAYGGTQAFEPDDLNAWTGVNPLQTSDAGVPVQAAAPTPAPQLPAGLTLEMAEQMVLELQKQTGMTLAYSKDCLEQVQWEFQRAVEVFANVRGSLPSEAFVQPVADGTT